MLGRILFAVVLVILAASPCQADLKDLLKEKGRKILFLGDSNTYAGLYIAYVEGYLRTRFPEEPWELINLGLPSETVSGLSEQDHPYPRPDIHERVDRALAQINPNIVFVCYGMNDGIYSPFDEKRLKKYKEGTEKLVAKIEKAGARVVLMTPSPFDATPISKNLLPKDAPKFSWLKPYENYDAEVLRIYSDYLLEWRKKDYIVVDAHAAVHRFLKAMRAKDSKYAVSGDGIHPNPTGHAVIAFEILRELKAPAEVGRIEVDFKTGKVRNGAGSTAEVSKNSLKVRFHGKTPMPTDTRWDKRLQEIEPYQDQFNRFPLVVTGLPVGKYEIVADQVVGSATSDELAKGISIAIFKGLRIFGDTAEVGKRIRARQQKVGLAWLTEIGHKRPDTPKGGPFAQTREYDEKERRELTELLQGRYRSQTQELLIRRVD